MSGPLPVDEGFWADDFSVDWGTGVEGGAGSRMAGMPWKEMA